MAPAEIESAFQLYADNGRERRLPGPAEVRVRREAVHERGDRCGEEGLRRNADRHGGVQRILRYEWQVCGNGTPDSATDVTFTGDKDSAYCKGEAKGQEAFGKIAEGGFDLAETKAFFTSDTLADTIDAKVQNAPSEISIGRRGRRELDPDEADPDAEKWGYDIRR